jgi:hypothetical protein
MLLQAVYHRALSTHVELQHCDGPFERTDDAFFHSIPLEIKSFNAALAVRAMFEVIVVIPCLSSSLVLMSFRSVCVVKEGS